MEIIKKIITTDYIKNQMNILTNNAYFPYVCVLFGVVVIYMFYRSFRFNKYKRAMVRSGFYKEVKNREGKIIRVPYKVKYIKKNKEAYMEAEGPHGISDIEKSMESLSSMLSIRTGRDVNFVEVEEKYMRRFPNVLKKKYFHLKEDNLPLTAKIPKRMPFSSVYLGIGMDGKDVLISTKDVFSYYYAGSTGDGKTVTMMMGMRSYLESVNYECRVMMFSAKSLDLVPVVKNLGGEFFSMNTLEEKRDALKELKKMICLQQESQKILELHGLVNFEDAREKGISIPLPRFMMLFDELASYTNSKRVFDKEEKQVTKEIISCIMSILATFRSTGSPVFLSSQRLNKDETEVVYDNIQAKILANISKEMDGKYREGRFYKKKLGQGIWTYSTISHSLGLIRTPFENEPFPSSLKAKKSLIIKMSDESEVSSNKRENLLDRSEHVDNLEKEIRTSGAQLVGYETPKKLKYKDSHIILIYKEEGNLTEKLTKLNEGLKKLEEAGIFYE